MEPEPWNLTELTLFLPLYYRPLPLVNIRHPLVLNFYIHQFETVNSTKSHVSKLVQTAMLIKIEMAFYEIARVLKFQTFKMIAILVLEGHI